MPQEDLRKQPLCHAEDLGKPIPNTQHAISMCLPRWKDVVGYEERNPDTMDKLQLGYPRFLYHPMVEAALATSKSEARRLIQQGAVSIDGDKTEDPFHELRSRDEAYLFKVGKRRFARLQID